mmetsp:Transcript_20339/g.48369  ORF Transcript_20339/g.48369 Transcript_20339/m.48369 type:complete len:551 (-) Transcript_20339:100-1752(-)
MSPIVETSSVTPPSSAKHAPLSPSPSSTSTTSQSQSQSPTIVEADHDRNNSHRTSSNAAESKDAPPPKKKKERIYYFGYGPIVNPVVRKRRGVRTVGNGDGGALAALLPDHKLTWAFGGVVNIVKQRGFEVMGILLEFDDEEEWSNFQQFDAGYDLDEVTVFPLQQQQDDEARETSNDRREEEEDDDDDDDDDDDGDGFVSHTNEPVKAYTFVMKDFDESKLLSSKIEKLPGERYLKLIATGMRTYGIDEDYINDQIMSVPYIPKRKPEQYRTFSTAAVSSSTPLPRITFAKYRSKLCSHNYRKTSPDDVFFISQGRVIKVERPDDPKNPSLVWLRDRVMGLTGKECTLRIHQTVVDPDIPMVDTPEEITTQHDQWCENHMVEWMEQGGLRGIAIFEIDDDSDHNNRVLHRRSSTASAALECILKYMCPCKDSLSAMTNRRSTSTKRSRTLPDGSRHSNSFHRSNDSLSRVLSTRGNVDGATTSARSNVVVSSSGGDEDGHGVDDDDHDHDDDATPTSLDFIRTVYGHGDTNDDDTAVDGSSTQWYAEHE